MEKAKLPGALRNKVLLVVFFMVLRRINLD